MSARRWLRIGLGVVGLLGACCIVALVGLFALVRSADDCPTGWSATAQAWLDENEDGRQDAGERPLRGVVFTIEGANTAGADPGRRTTGAPGTANVGVTLGCGGELPASAAIHAAPPPGYRSTTPNRVQAQRDLRSYAFGFTYQPGVPTPTPHPAMACAAYNRSILGSAAYVKDIDIAPDGAAWLTIFQGGLVKFSARQGEQAVYKSDADGLPLDAVGVAVAADGTLWAWAGPPGRLVRFDGATWTSYTPPSQLEHSDFMADIAIAPDGSVWLGATTPDYVGRFIPATGKWETYRLGQGLAQWATSFVAAPDNSLWLTDYDGNVKHLTPPAAAQDQAVWRTYSRTHESFYGLAAQTIALAEDGTLWALSNDGVDHLDPATGAWSEYHDLTVGRTTGIAIAPDRSLWLATNEGMLHVTLARDPAAAPTTAFYTTQDGLISDSAEDFVIAPDGVLWIGHVGGLSRCVITR